MKTLFITVLYYVGVFMGPLYHFDPFKRATLTLVVHKLLINTPTMVYQYSGSTE